MGICTLTNDMARMPGACRAGVSKLGRLFSNCHGLVSVNPYKNLQARLPVRHHKNHHQTTKPANQPNISQPGLPPCSRCQPLKV